jgi:hypothetical protein
MHSPLSKRFHYAILIYDSYTNPIAWDNLPHHYDLCAFYTVWIFLELLFVYFFYVETRGPTLEELAKIFDGEDAEVAHLDMNEIEKDIHVDHTNDEKKGIQSNVAAA